MNVKELETRTGMARANIRYYESEGLIHPQRLPNGYRDYSEEDLIALEKIKLLRELGVEINTIRMLQDGSLSLQQVLFGQLNRIEGEQVLLDRQRDVCKQLESMGLEYGALEPAPWLARLEAPAQQQALPQEEEPQTEVQPLYQIQLKDYEPATYHPWRRYFARAIDFVLWDFLLTGLECLVNCFSKTPFHLGLPRFLRDYLVWYLTLFAEPLLLSCFGWTVGKWLFGLKLRTSTGEKPSLPILWKRTLSIIRSGYGYFIPGYTLYRLWKSYQDIRDETEPDWNWDWDCRYEQVERRGGSAAGVVGYVAAIAAAVLITALQPSVFWMVHAAHLPDLQTVEALYQNIADAGYVPDPNTAYLSEITPEQEAEHTTVTFQQEPDGSVSATITKQFVNEPFHITFNQELDAVDALFGVEKPLRQEEENWMSAFGQLDRFAPSSGVVFRGMEITQELQVEDNYTGYSYQTWNYGYVPTSENSSYIRIITIKWTGDAHSWFYPLTR